MKTSLFCDSSLRGTVRVALFIPWLSPKSIARPEIPFLFVSWVDLRSLPSQGSAGVALHLSIGPPIGFGVRPGRKSASRDAGAHINELWERLKWSNSSR